MSSVAVLWASSYLLSISSEISDEKAVSILESLKARKPDLYEKMTLLFERHKKRNTYDRRSFSRYVVDLLYEQTKNSLSMGRFAGHPISICDPIRGCDCCESFNQKVREHSFRQAINEIDKMLKEPSNSFELFHEFADLAFQNASKHEDELVERSLHVEASLQIASSAALPVAAAALSTSTNEDEDEDDCAMYD
jgi:hypothetical protein